METRRYEVRIITEGKRWPVVGRAFSNSDGSLNVYL